MPFVELVDRTVGPYERCQGRPDGFLVTAENRENVHRAKRVMAAAKASRDAMGNIEPSMDELATLPLVRNDDLLRHSGYQEKWREIIANGRWYASNWDSAVNLDHPDIKAVL